MSLFLLYCHPLHILFYSYICALGYVTFEYSIEAHTQAHSQTHTHTFFSTIFSPFLSPSSNTHTHTLSVSLSLSFSFSSIHTHTHTQLHSRVKKWLYLCCQVCSQRWLWPQTEICSLLHHRGYNDKAAPNIYFLICPLDCNCYHLCQLSWIGVLYCWQAFSCFSISVSQTYYTFFFLLTFNSTMENYKVCENYS